MRKLVDGAAGHLKFLCQLAAFLCEQQTRRVLSMGFLGANKKSNLATFYLRSITSASLAWLWLTQIENSFIRLRKISIHLIFSQLVSQLRGRKKQSSYSFQTAI